MKKENIKAYVFLTPALLASGIFVLFPSLSGVLESFLRVSSDGSINGFAGLENFKLLFCDPSFTAALKNTLLFVILFVPVNTFITLLATSLTRRASKHSSLPEYIMFTPLAISLSAYCLVFKELFKGKNSVISRIFHTSYGWLNEPLGAMLTLVFLGVFLDFGLDYILLLSAFRSNDKSVIEAARIDGAGGYRLFFLVELPMVMDTVWVTVFLALKDALLISAPILILTEGGPFRSTETIMFYYYTEAFRSGNRGVQNALSALILFSTALVMALAVRRKRK